MSSPWPLHTAYEYIVCYDGHVYRRCAQECSGVFVMQAVCLLQAELTHLTGEKNADIAVSMCDITQRSCTCKGTL